MFGTSSCLRSPTLTRTRPTTAALSDGRLGEGCRVEEDVVQLAVIVSMNRVVSRLKGVGDVGGLSNGKGSEIGPAGTLHLDIDVRVFNHFGAGAHLDFTLLDVVESFEVACGKASSNLNLPGLNSGNTEEGGGIIVIGARLAVIVTFYKQQKKEGKSE